MTLQLFPYRDRQFQQEIFPKISSMLRGKDGEFCNSTNLILLSSCFWYTALEFFICRVANRKKKRFTNLIKLAFIDSSQYLLWIRTTSGNRSDHSYFHRGWQQHKISGTHSGSICWFIFGLYFKCCFVRKVPRRSPLLLLELFLSR